jgi:hypothetical protein
MRCAKCGTESRTGRKFCANCGSALAIRCPKCAAKNEPLSKFCEDCGAALTEAPSNARVEGVPLPQGEIHVAAKVNDSDGAALEGERKTVTALFADIKGSMELMEDLDPEDARAIVDPALKLMMDAVHRYGGFVVQSTGDGIFALFGRPWPMRTIRNEPCTPPAGCRRSLSVTPTSCASGGSRRYRFGWESTAEKW